MSVNHLYVLFEEVSVQVLCLLLFVLFFFLVLSCIILKESPESFKDWLENDKILIMYHLSLQKKWQVLYRTFNEAKIKKTLEKLWKIYLVFKEW